MELAWEDDETLRLELAPSGSGCVLTLINRFDEIGKAARDAAGWHACLDALSATLDGSSVDAGAVWQFRAPGVRVALRPRGRDHRSAARLSNRYRGATGAAATHSAY